MSSPLNSTQPCTVAAAGSLISLGHPPPPLCPLAFTSGWGECCKGRGCLSVARGSDTRPVNADLALDRNCCDSLSINGGPRRKRVSSQLIYKYAKAGSLLSDGRTGRVETALPPHGQGTESVVGASGRSRRWFGNGWGRAKIICRNSSPGLRANVVLIAARSDRSSMTSFVAITSSSNC